MDTRPCDTAPRVVVIDDDPATRMVIGEILDDAGYQTILWDGLADPLHTIAQAQPDVVIQDVRLGLQLGVWDLLDHIDRLRPARVPAVVLCTADRDFIRTHRQALEDRSCAIVEKPFDIDAFIRVVAGCVALSRR